MRENLSEISMKSVGSKCLYFTRDISAVVICICGSLKGIMGEFNESRSMQQVES